jgi:hypothetical protein
MAPRDPPDQAPDPDGGFDLSKQFKVLIQSTDALQQAVADQTQQIRYQIDQEVRLAQAGGGHEGGTGHLAAMQYQPQMRQQALRSLARTGGMPSDPTMGMTKVSTLQATTSLQSAQAWAAQWMGQQIANRLGTGESIYEPHAPGVHAEQAGNAVHVPPGAPATAQPGGTFQPIAQAIAQGAAGPVASGLGWPGAQAQQGGQTAQAISAALGAVASKAGGTPPPSGTGGTPPTGGGGGGRSQQFWQNVGTRVAASGGGAGGVLGLLKHIPGVGLVADLANKGANIYSEQREAGRVYQEIEGGQNLGAQTERAHAFAYEASMFGRVPEGVAAQMFGDVTGMGFTQRAVGQGQQLQNRQSALDFMYHQYTATGTDVQQSAQILETASRSATISLKSVSDVMTSLSDTAGKAGVNAKEARDNFNSMLGAAIQAGAGPGAPQLAGALATTQASYGNAFKGANFAGQLAPSMQYMLAGQYGITPATAQYLQRSQPGEYARMLAGSEAQFISQLPGMDPGKMADLQQRIEAAGGGAQVRAQPGIAQDIANKFLDAWQTTTPAMDMNVWAQFLSQVTGKKLDASNVMVEVVEMAAGNTQAANAQAGAPGGSKAGGQGGAGAPVTAGAAGRAGAGGAATGQYGLAQSTAATHGAGPKGMENITPGRTWQQVLQGGDQGAAGKVYLGAEGKSGKRSPVLEALLQNLPKGAKVSVQTASGVRVMSVEDAMKYYPDEMAAGNVQFFNKEGQNLGSTSTITQGLVDPTAQQGAAAEQASKGAGTKAGTTMGQAHVGTARGADAKQGVTVDLTNEAKQLLKLLPGNSDNAAAAATVPQNPYTTSPSR